MNDVDSPDWILAFQTPFDRVKFITSNIETSQSLKYADFLKYIQSSFSLKEYHDFLHCIDTFKDVLILCKLRTWTIYKSEVKVYTSKELMIHNRPTALKTSRTETVLNNSRTFIQSVVDANKKKFEDRL